MKTAYRRGTFLPLPIVSQASKPIQGIRDFWQFEKKTRQKFLAPYFDLGI
jgi:hypothetical protein